ncbi:MAG TPA: thermonuclease family protein, partial [Pseudonocardiaceae bacterium]|nr:thermonuclease family protein [Pseudonocardiaceae bacterium]
MSVPRYTLIRGEFYICYPDLPRNGPEPDGDTINFLPDNDDLVGSLPRFGNTGPDRRHLGTYGTRFEGIDTLETHFENQHQDLHFAHGARDRMLQLMGFGDVVFWPDRPNKIRSAEHHPRPGYLLANGIEGNGRVLALVFPGQPALDAVDGDSVFVDVAALDASVNAELVRNGLAYAELYSTMPIDLIHQMRQLVTAARQAGLGLWPHEHVTTTARAQLKSLADLSTLIMFPKLYRRLVKYFQAGHTDLAAFDTWIRADPNRDDRV